MLLNRYVIMCFMIYYLLKILILYKLLYVYVEKKFGYVIVYDVMFINRIVYDLVF